MVQCSHIKTLLGSLFYTHINSHALHLPGNRASAEGIQNVMWPRVWPGVSNTCTVWPPNANVSPSPTHWSMPGMRFLSASGPMMVTPCFDLSSMLPPCMHVCADSGQCEAQGMAAAHGGAQAQELHHSKQAITTDGNTSISRKGFVTQRHLSCSFAPSKHISHNLDRRFLWGTVAMGVEPPAPAPWAKGVHQVHSSIPPESCTAHHSTYNTYYS